MRALPVRLSVLLVAGGASVPACGSEEADPPRFVGTAPSSEDDLETSLPYFSQLTPENAGKWGVVEAERGEMDWEVLDRTYEFARENDLEFKFHALVWGNQEPAWVAALDPEEQLEELEEWFEAVAERYPDLEMIDVVNEPLHAPPSYAEALGGAGESGWDWVVRAFEMARTYFPESELIVNDYDILKHESFVDDYLEPIHVLRERGLVDAIGLQAHNLEKSEVVTLEENLATLAATSLPLYITEFDLDISDDALHARVFRDFFTTFWESGKVSGITFWGHLQGDTWRPNTYLLRSDRSERPALSWLQCFTAGEGPCDIPGYEPAPRRGSSNGLTVQAESFDATSGLITLGPQIGYADEGDWVSYLGIEFQKGWEQLTVVYQNGRDTTGTLSFRLDELDEEPVLSLPVEPTGSWNTSASLTVDWPETKGRRDLFVRFEGADGIGNFDKFRFGEPPAEFDGVNLVVGGDFEIDTTGWSAWGGSVAVSLDHVYEGEQSLLLADRSAYGSATYDLRRAVTPGESYDLSLVVDVSGDEVQEVNVSKLERCEGEPHSLEPLFDPTAVEPGEWEIVEGRFDVADCNLAQFLLLISGPSQGIDLYLDDVSVEER